MVTAKLGEGWSTSWLVCRKGRAFPSNQRGGVCEKLLPAPPSLCLGHLALSTLRPPQDEKYWSRRYKNNEAAKRSRDARRLKENQISVRAAFLEKENALLRQEVVAVRQELSHYRAVLSRYQAQHGAL